MPLFTFQQRYKYYFSCCIFLPVHVRFFPSADLSQCVFFRVRFFPCALLSECAFFPCAYIHMRFFPVRFFPMCFFPVRFFRSASRHTRFLCISYGRQVVAITQNSIQVKKTIHQTITLPYPPPPHPLPLQCLMTAGERV